MSLDINLTNVQSKAVVVSTNQIAVNDASYTVVANSIFTDPTPVEGKGYRVFVRNGTATINSVGYTVGTSIFRVFHSGSWISYVSLPDSNFVPTTRTINGYDLSANRTLSASDVGAVATNSAITGATKTKITFDAKGLITSGADATTADIADSSNKRYVTDANLTVIGNTSGTNTGDQTFFNPRVQTVSSSATVTAVSTNDIVTITAQAEGLTLANPTGTFSEGQSLIFRIKDNATARTITYGANFRAIGVTAPTTTVISKTTYIGCIYNSTDTKFDIIGVCTEA